MEKSKTQSHAPKDIVILGAGGHGKELASYLEDLEKHDGSVRFLGFIDDYKSKGFFAGRPLLGGFDHLADLLSSRKNSLYYITATGTNEIRIKFVERIQLLPKTKILPWILLHPKANLGRNVKIGEGTCVCPGSVITTDAEIGRHCIVNVQASISHDAVIGDFTNVNPGVRVCDNVRVGEGCYLGAGSTVIDKMTLGKNVVIGAGAVVTQSMPDSVTAVGVPARVIKKNASLLCS